MENKLGSLLVASTIVLTGCIDNGGGQKVGVITRIAVHKVLGLCGTNEGEIVRGGLNAGTGVQGAPFHFTIEDAKLLPKVTDAMERGEEVEIMYETEAFTLCRSASENHFITDIKPVKRPSGNVTAKVESPVGVYQAEKPKDSSKNDDILKLLKTQQELIQRLIEKQNQDYNK